MNEAPAVTKCVTGPVAKRPRTPASVDCASCLYGTLRREPVVPVLV